MIALALLLTAAPDPFFSAAVRADAGNASFAGVVELDGAPFAGATVTAVEPFSFEKREACGDGDRPDCVCTAARAFSQQLERHAVGPAIVGRARSGDGGVFHLEHLPDHFGLWLDAPDAGSRYVANPRRDPLWLAPGVYTEGRVVDGSGAPVAHAQISVIRPEGRVFDGESDADGGFKVGPLAGAPLQVFIRRDGYLPELFNVGSRRPAILSRALDLQVEVRQLDGGAAAGVKVTGGDERHCHASAVTSPSGTAVLSNLRALWYPLTVTAGEPTFGDRARVDLMNPLLSLVLHPTAALQVPALDGGRGSVWANVYCPGTRDDSAGGTALFDGQLDATGCAIAFRERRYTVALDAGAVTELSLDRLVEPSQTIEVRVIDSRGRTVDAQALAWQTTEASPTGLARVEYGAPVTLPHGEWLVSAESGDEAAIPQKIRVPFKGERLVLHTVRAPKLTGTIRDAQGNPIAGATVSLSRGFKAVKTGAGGRFALPVDHPGPCELEVSVSRGDLFRRQRFDTWWPRAQPVDLKMPPTALTTGQIAFTDGGVAEGKLSVSLEADPLNREKATLTRGRFSCELPLGDHDTRLERADGGWMWVTPALEGGQHGVKLVAHEHPTVSGQLIDGAGRPITDFQIGAHPWHDDGGFFSLQTVAGIELSLVADAGDRAGAGSTRGVRRGQTGRWTFVAPHRAGGRCLRRSVALGAAAVGEWPLAPGAADLRLRKRPGAGPGRRPWPGPGGGETLAVDSGARSGLPVRRPPAG
ncbi:MAG: carboxypeptidase-like regulatory domain-containing protein [Myxococcaceae bacterium]